MFYMASRLLHLKSIFMGNLKVIFFFFNQKYEELLVPGPSLCGLNEWESLQHQIWRVLDSLRKRFAFGSAALLPSHMF